MGKLIDDIEIFKTQIQQGGFVGLAQINLVAGDLEFNSKKIIECIKEAEEAGLDMILFPRYSLMGESMSDFIQRYPFILDECEKYLELIAQNCTKTAALIGYINKEKQYSCAILRNGVVDKILLNTNLITSKEFHDGVEFYIKPISEASRGNSQAIREKELKELAIKLKRPILEINQVGAIDCNSYAGQSCVCDENGEIFSRAKDFKEQILIVNPFKKIGKIYSVPPILKEKSFSLDYEWDLERTYKSAVQGIRDYFSKCNLKRAVLGLSGGLDSTVCAVLLVDALGKENVYGVSMPSKLTSEESKSDAQQLAENLGIGFSEMTIKPMFETTNDCLQSLFLNVEKNWPYRYKTSFTPDNIQARSRAIYLWGIANEFEACIPIATSDKSELYMGYATINGDMSGGFAPISDITKTKLFALARWINKNREQQNVIPESIILKRPGAELAIDPSTGKTLFAEDALMPYEFMDEVIWRIENLNESYKELMDIEFVYEKKNSLSKDKKIEWLDKFFRRMSGAIYKGYIMPPYTIIDSETINKTLYRIPITSSKINYKN